MLKTVVGGFVLVGLLVTGAAAILLRHGSDSDLPALRLATVERGDLHFTIEATGTVEPEDVVDVGAQVAGKIQSLGDDPRPGNGPIDYRSPVKVGTVLARIDDSLYQSDVEQAKALVQSCQAQVESTSAGVLESQANVLHAEKDLLQTKARLYKAERDWTRAQGLKKTLQGAMSDADYDLAKSTYDAADAAVGVADSAVALAKATMASSQAAVEKAKADLSSARATLQRSETNLGYCTIKSPVDGVIIDRRINVGQTVVSSLNSPSLFLIAKDLKRLEVWASVNEADIGYIKSGQNVWFTVDGYGKKFKGVVAPDQPRLNASMNQNVVTYTVVIDTDNSNLALIPYRTADLHFDVAHHKDVLLVPNTALRWQPSAERLASAGLPPQATGKRGHSDANKSDSGTDNLSPGEGTVWIQENGTLRPVKVNTVMTDGTQTEIAADSLQEGAQVVIGEAVPTKGEQTTDPFMPKIFGNRRQPQQQQ
jgi:HlyD family secretion protein